MHIVSLALLPFSLALYEREAGHFDWKLSSIGIPKSGALNPKVSDGLVVVTESSAVATIHIGSGEVVWRTKACSGPSRIMGFNFIQSGAVAVLCMDEVVVLGLDDGSRKWSLAVVEGSWIETCGVGSSKLKLMPAASIVHAMDGGPSALDANESCTTLKSAALPFPLSVKEYEIRVEEGHLFHCSKQGSLVWSREEALASVADAEIVSRPILSQVSGERDLEWLMGGSKRAVLLSSAASRLVIVDVATGKTVSGFNVSGKVNKLRRGKREGTVELIAKDGETVVGSIDAWSGLLPVSRSSDRFRSANVTVRINRESGEIAGHSTLEAGQVVWRVNLRSKILHVIEPRHSELGNVPVLVKSDASVVFKYMNPNLVVIISRAMDSGISVSALDAVTGALVHQTVIASAAVSAGSRNFVLCDNWIVGHYFNAADNRFELIAIDFFEKRSDKGFFAAATGKAKSLVDSAYQLPLDVIALVQQFVFPLGPVTAISVTGTLMGVTPRQVLFATNSGVYAVKKDTWLNPRRPLVAQTGEESLPVYSALLPVNAGEFLTHRHVVENVKKILTVPTHLESTSLALVIGELDIFSAPIYPGSAPYDVLSPFFNYSLLAFSVALVIASVLATSVLAHRKQLYNKWI